MEDRQLAQLASMQMWGTSSQPSFDRCATLRGSQEMGRGGLNGMQSFRMQDLVNAGSGFHLEPHERIPSLQEAVEGLREALALAPERREVDPAQGVAKGTWLPEEDKILVAYVAHHGPKNWNSLQAKGLLKRNGKSCRLRWVNQLKPGLMRNMHGKGCKRFTESEERLVIQLQKTMGNRWAQISKFLPGRTDNDVKNFWNLHIKRLERVKGSHQSKEAAASSKERRQPQETIQRESFDQKPKNLALDREGQSHKSADAASADGGGSSQPGNESSSLQPSSKESSESQKIDADGKQLPLQERRRVRNLKLGQDSAGIAQALACNASSLTGLSIDCPTSSEPPDGKDGHEIEKWLRTPRSPWFARASPTVKSSPMNISPHPLRSSPKGNSLWEFLSPKRLSPRILFGSFKPPSQTSSPGRLASGTSHSPSASSSNLDAVQPKNAKNEVSGMEGYGSSFSDMASGSSGSSQLSKGGGVSRDTATVALPPTFQMFPEGQSQKGCLKSASWSGVRVKREPTVDNESSNPQNLTLNKSSVPPKSPLKDSGQGQAVRPITMLGSKLRNSSSFGRRGPDAGITPLQVPYPRELKRNSTFPRSAVQVQEETKVEEMMIASPWRQMAEDDELLAELPTPKPDWDTLSLLDPIVNLEQESRLLSIYEANAAPSTSISADSNEIRPGVSRSEIKGGDLGGVPSGSQLSSVEQGNGCRTEEDKISRKGGEQNNVGGVAASKNSLDLVSASLQRIASSSSQGSNLGIDGVSMRAGTGFSGYSKEGNGTSIQDLEEAMGKEDHLAAMQTSWQVKELLQCLLNSGNRSQLLATVQSNDHPQMTAFNSATLQQNLQNSNSVTEQQPSNQLQLPQPSRVTQGGAPSHPQNGMQNQMSVPHIALGGSLQANSHSQEYRRDALQQQQQQQQQAVQRQWREQQGEKKHAALQRVQQRQFPPAPSLFSGVVGFPTLPLPRPRPLPPLEYHWGGGRKSF